MGSVYAKVQLGTCTLETKPAENFDGKDSVNFEGKGELFLFKYSEEKEVQVGLKDRRLVQSIFGGDPVIGTAVLSLDHDLADGHLQQKELSIKRDGVVTGKVMLYYQLLQVQ